MISCQGNSFDMLPLFFFWTLYYNLKIATFLDLIARLLFLIKKTKMKKENIKWVQPYLITIITDKSRYSNLILIYLYFVRKMFSYM